MFIFDEFLDSDVILPEGTLLLNIETTGLSPRNAFIYMIGVGWQSKNGLQTRCLLAGSRMDERKLMETFYGLLNHYSRILTFGGRSFSARFMSDRWTNYSDNEKSLFEGLVLEDIQKKIAPFKTTLSLTDLKKDTLEDFLGFHRQSRTSGKELIQIFGEWERNHDDTARRRLLVHHRDDMMSILCLYRLSAYTAFCRGSFSEVLSWQLKENVCCFQLLLHFPVPRPVHYKTRHCIITLDGEKADLMIPFFEGRLKFFLPGPVKDYYYLPAEDQAVHRCVACYVDKSHRQKATAATCYTHTDGIFLPTDSREITPYFQTDYHSKEFYILYDPEKWQKDPDILNRYLISCIKEPPQFL